MVSKVAAMSIEALGGDTAGGDLVVVAKIIQYAIY